MRVDQSRFLLLLYTLCSKTPETQLSEITQVLKSCQSNETLQSVLTRIPTSLNSDTFFILQTYLKEVCSNMSWSEIGWSMDIASSLCQQFSNEQSSELVWTGPSSEALAFRRNDQILYDLILNSTTRILLVTFAAARIDRLKDALQKAINNDVHVRLILEFGDQSEGQLSISAIKAFSDEIQTNAEIYYWPVEKRERNKAGRPGKLHTKCAVIDNDLMISSANLTDDAFNRNMELGVLIRAGSLPQLTYDHFSSLISRDVLRRWV